MAKEFKITSLRLADLEKELNYLKTTRMNVPLEELLRSFTMIPGVVKAEVMAG